MSVLPRPRGPLSGWAIDALAARNRSAFPQVDDDPLHGDDLHLALYLLYELHYEGFDGVDPRLEWDPELLAFRRELENAFEAAVLELVPVTLDLGERRLPEVLTEIVAGDDGPPLARYLETQGSLDQFLEFVIHRSAYQLKEADPHSWVIPRLRGPGKAALLEIQADEYGSGREDRVHAVLFANTMRSLGLDPNYGAYVDLLPGITLATVNLMSLFGLHRRWRGASVGHLVGFEMTSPEPNRRYGNGLRRLGFGADTTHFYDEHVEADSVHEVIATHDLAGRLAESDPGIALDIVFGLRALLALENLWAAHLLQRWESGTSSLLEDVAVARGA